MPLEVGARSGWKRRLGTRQGRFESKQHTRDRSRSLLSAHTLYHPKPSLTVSQFARLGSIVSLPLRKLSKRG